MGLMPIEVQLPRPVTRVLKHDPYCDLTDAMEFRLVYEGELLGSGGSNTRSEHKHHVRRVFHPQLRRLWENTAHLREWIEHEVKDARTGAVSSYSQLQTLADKFSFKGFRFAPLATRELELLCGIDVLLLRYDDPKTHPLLKSGDIDNRLKTVFDALQMPQVNQIDPRWATPQDGEDPFFVLLEDDELINRVSVTTDLLLRPTRNENDAQVIITVAIRPSRFGTT